MTLKSVIINGTDYKYYHPDSYTDYKLLLKQITRIKQKIKASEVGGMYHGIIGKNGVPWYGSYPELLVFLEGLLEK